MTKVVMMLGAYPFMLDTAAYQQLKRSSKYRWKELDRIARKPAQQYLGLGADQITLSGESCPIGKVGSTRWMRCAPRRRAASLWCSWRAMAVSCWAPG